MRRKVLTQKLMAGLLTSVMAVSLLAGCGNSTAQPAESAETVKENTAAEETAGQTEEESAAEVSAADPFAKYDETVTISAVKNLGTSAQVFPEGDDLSDNVWTRYSVETLNVAIDWKWSTVSEQYDQKVNIAITSNDIPDIMQVNAVQLKMMYENGQLMDMTDILDENLAPFTREVLYSDGGQGIKAASFDGRVYAIPCVTSPLANSQVLWVRTDWLENLGMDLPETVEDFRALAEAFTTQDPDGNGVDDTYGLAIYKDLYGSNYADLVGFFNMYGAYPDIWVDQGDKIVWGGVQPEAKDALTALNEMYKAGQLDPEFGVKDANKVNEDVSAGRFGMMFGGFWNMAWINDAKVADPTFEWVPVAIPDLNENTPSKAQLPLSTSNFYAISAECEHPEATVRMLNLYLEKAYGETAEPLKFNITPEGYGAFDYYAVSLEPPMKNFTAAEMVTGAINGDIALEELNDEQLNYYEMSMKSLDGDHTNNNWHQLKMFGPGGSLGVMYAEYWETGDYVIDAYYAAPTDTMTEKLSTLEKQQLQDYTTIILEGNLDKFDEFVTNWNKLGGEDITAEINEWYAGLE